MTRIQLCFRLGYQAELTGQPCTLIETTERGAWLKGFKKAQEHRGERNRKRLKAKWFADDVVLLADPLSE